MGLNMVCHYSALKMGGGGLITSMEPDLRLLRKFPCVQAMSWFSLLSKGISSRGESFAEQTLHRSLANSYPLNRPNPKACT